MLEKTITYIFSSDTENGAFNVSEDGSEFATVLYSPIAIPHNARYCKIGVQAANIWYTTPNISIALDNNTFAFFDGTVNQSITIPNGLYDLPQLASSIAILIDNIPATIPSANLFDFFGDGSTQRVIITFKSAGLSIDWNASTLRTILGFRTTSPTTAPINGSIAGEDTAKFNQINSYLIHTDLIHTGIPVNSIDTAVISNVFIDVTPGSLINYTPQIIPTANGNELIGSVRSTIVSYITDQKGRRVDTNGEVWNYTLMITYYED